METIIYVVTSANGQILLTSPDGYQSPVEVLQDSFALAIQTGNLVVGFNTYKIFSGNPDAIESFKGIDLVVLSDNQQEVAEGVTFLDNIEAVVEFLKAKGHSKIFVAGGAYTYQSFINAGYIDELYLNFTPLLTGNGAALVTDTATNKTLSFIGSKLLSESIIQLHYKVK